ncbi:16S rRNA (adenine(1518)-N(6)/adenine(1519)-N(6))-dimethyltransferase RsmA [Ferribacterium limneticum]|uniref:16S rRNA (adenine(1518)-N(6)/adenine(1519)-N(6))- dimethyltransferase RsmA n=1 Tax=Ferribacterium limneticum TaxID=76259 RepID=UPI001CFABBBF|nr:16S rRNA (adenine(1518)-N(6)/adenine(1519)-N(6))-dimethyltransferase RsmA [Ferribacterium limneticum]UCV27962.1 16S rRNA (adenine(1518)-N(6)/adenine(1519)-N(6))-dimethyltransferase RsmA [Ferribacterium limneticum]UCV31879.1 16S rRNA (adenine(1518)-N(6)/adenine(1519)-N(6))-dimethyltransferase RsmA [Ferribacterium limneticum]
MKGHVARKRFGQNFLVDHGIIAAIISAIDPKRDETVVEIGPGLGAITEPLMARVDHLHVVEIDRDLIARLKKQHAPDRMTIHEGDALAFDFASIGKDLRLVGNLPYNISTPLLFHLAEYVDIVRDMHFMLQKEVVERMVAEPGDADFGRMSVMLQYRFYLEWLIDVPPESFNPAPKVDSAVVRLIPKPVSELNAKSQEKLSQVVLTAFSQRRKMLRNTMKSLLSEAAFAELGIDPTLRAEDVPVEDYVRIANYLS